MASEVSTQCSKVTAAAQWPVDFSDILGSPPLKLTHMLGATGFARADLAVGSGLNEARLV
jgi:hypothetical protein